MSATQVDIDLIRRQTFIASVEHHAVLASTNDRAAQCAKEGTHALPLLIVTDEQTAGRGRGAKRWWTGPGGLAFTLLLSPETFGGTAGSRSPLAALAVAVAVVEALSPLVPDHVLGIHWPNDVMADGRKLAGILIEVLPDGRHIVGIGVNTNNSAVDAPLELRPRVATLRDLAGRGFDRTEILIALLRRLESNFGRLAAEAEAIAVQADALCQQHGQVLTVELAGQEIAGLCQGIARDGGLLLVTAQGTRRLYSGVMRTSVRE
jgi:BirA family biotin operon repressor/biotin-[acetyl-CoA-carboxylase] ligase